MTDDLDLRLSAAFRSLDLPAADPRLRDTLEALRKRGSARAAGPNRRPWVALLAAAAAVVLAVAVVLSQLRAPSLGPPATPTPVPTQSPATGPTPSADSTG